MELKKSETIVIFEDDSGAHDINRFQGVYVVQKDFDVTELSAEFRKSHCIDSPDGRLFNLFYRYLIEGDFIKRISYIKWSPWHQQRKGGLRLELLKSEGGIENVSLWNAITKFDKEGFII